MEELLAELTASLNGLFGVINRLIEDAVSSASSTSTSEIFWKEVQEDAKHSTVIEN